ncbi:GreA/GreB family elongation factor [Streptomyces sp. NPDC058232]|uniref:GreA/GreB family elongation factor n=1 Tax=unclassified Streptomyces TaxID=2593676 RepID=UPI0028C46561|nr:MULTISPECIES: GreA/GreB family elongation factor [unclassified Streptomyces]WNO68666.1 GreA/GreB family elongation factor [Streptomyces sp. AM2-3-1]WSC73313.1 GreA/GreB family elongation factor [Streptomyces sp. NBC_01760]WTE63757.1 GreA/GreB family elongation factor [Streptomyces sp. NBC_01617]WTI91042.1 GreA/GreB family elongation factor [Streptomyces sp. NBC_00724]
MTGGPEPISDVAREALERELADLRAERETVAATLRGGERVGDRADEADELQRGTELDRLDTRIAEVDGRLREAAVAGPPRTDRVGVGSSVTVRFADTTEATVQIGEVAEVLDPTLVTSDSPLGRALLGCRAGDTISYETPEGRSTAVVLSLGDEDDRS